MDKVNLPMFSGDYCQCGCICIHLENKRKRWLYIMRSKLLEYLETLGSYLLIGLTVLGLLIMYGVSSAAVFNWTFFLFGLMLLVLPIISYLLITRVAAKDNLSYHSNYLKKLKTHGEKIEVNLSDCEIKSNSWTDQKPRYNDSRIEFLNTISGHADKNIAATDVNLSTAIYRINRLGKTRIFESGTIALDEVTLRMLFEVHGRTIIYIDKDNPEYYYFDLEFLSR